MNKNSQQLGFTLMETLVSLFIIMILMIGVYNLVLLYLQVSNDNKMHVIAIELANQKMEQIRNMPYDDVGVVGGSPYGIIPQEEIVEREGRFTVNSYVQFYDDPADGQAGSSTPDTIPTDYKIVTVKVNWQRVDNIKTVTVFSKIIPRTVETDQGYGLLKLTVRNSYAQPVPSASVRVVNNAVTPAIDVVNLTNSDGLLYLPATSSVDAYEITVSKTDEEPAVYWGRDRTYAASSGKIPRHLSVSKGDMIEEEFQVDPLATLRLRTVSASLPDNFQVNSTKSARQESQPRAATDGSDNIFFAWQGENSTSSHVYVGKYDSSGSRLWANDTTVYNSMMQRNPDIAAEASGDIYVVWQDSSVALKAITVAPGETRYAHSDEKQKSVAQSLYDFMLSRGSAFKNDLLLLYDKSISELRSVISRTGKNIISTRDKIHSWRKSILKHTAETMRINEANAVGTIVQSIKVSGVVTSDNDVTLSFTNPPTAGNLMIVVAIHENSSREFTNVTNAAGSFTASVVSNAAFGLDVGIWHKVAAAGEPSAVTVNANGDFEGGVMMLLEVSGIDTADPVDVTIANNQTGSNSRTATTGSTAASTANGFAVAAVTFADNDFNNPTSANWTSGSGDPWTQLQWTEINGDDDTSIGVATMDVTAAAAQSATLAVTGGGSTEERNSVMVVYNLYDPDDVRVDPGGLQNASLLKGLTGQYIGGYFAISDLTGSHNVTGIQIAENGTIDAQNNLDNIKLFYDLDTTAPYDCAGESYGGTEAQFGVTDTDGFSAADGIVQMNGSVAINTTKTMCVYVVLDIGAGADKDETIELEITNPTTDVSINTGTVIPANISALTGTTRVSVPAETHQSIYRWRGDSGDEDGANWLADASSAASIRSGEKARLRFQVKNEGSISVSSAYRLEYGKKVTTCSALGVGSWIALPGSDAGEWRSTSSAYYLDGDATTQQLGMGLFMAGEIKEDSNQTSGLALDGDTSTEIEFALAPTANIDDGTYCFRLTNAGAALSIYEVYAEAIVEGDDNIYIIKLDSSGIPIWAAKRANNDDSNTDQSRPRIALTENFGTATTVVVWQDGRNGQSDIYAQAFDKDGNAIWNSGNEIVISASTTDEIEPTVVIDSNDNVIFAWTEDDVADKVYMIKYDLQGNPLWPSPIPDPTATSEISEPSLAVDGSENFYLGYTENAMGNFNANIAKYDSAGVKIWDKDINKDSDAGDRYESALAVKGANLYSVWTDKRDGNEDIYGQKYDLNGNPAWSRDLLISITVAVSSGIQPAMAVTTSDKPFAAWTDSRNPEIAIYAAEMSAPGAITPVPNVNLHIWGANTLSETPQIFEYDLYRTTNGSGQSDILVETDSGGYSVVSSSTYTIMLLDPPMPMSLLPSQDQIWNIYVQ